ncbi:SigE family RNA polymerase sigma factor [Dactylosporangium salmoneum]|uniref:SigE family RNA polymerase sigma factor n=1 Tax=Dactylosporangium salmoneum TaxID=53361 RepID=A0ABP5TUV9_9ACTN
MTKGSGPDAPFEAFVEVAWRRHLRLAMLLTGDPSRAEELLQDSLVKLYERWGKIRSEDGAHAYLRRILTNSQISWWRRRFRERLVAEVPDRSYEPIGAHPDADVLRQALLALPPRQRAVVVLRHYEDLSEREIAHILGCTEGTVKSQNARALQRLRRTLQQPALNPQR